MAFSTWSNKKFRDVIILTKDGVEYTNELVLNFRKLEKELVPYFDKIDRKFKTMLKEPSKEGSINKDAWAWLLLRKQEVEKDDFWNSYVPTPIPFPKFIKQLEPTEPYFNCDSNTTSNKGQINLIVNDSTDWS